MLARDLGILIVAGLAVLISFRHGFDFSLRFAWYHEVDVTLYKNAHYPDPLIERLPPPVITDLDGDGTIEVVLCTNDGRLLILDPTDGYDSSYGGGTSGTPMDSAPVKAEASLLPAMRIKTGRAPVALATGYINRYVAGKPRKQIIAVLTEEWTVLVFDYRAKLMWESSVHPEHSTEPMFFHEASILISAAQIMKGDLGSVIIGGRMEYVDKFGGGHPSHHIPRPHMEGEVQGQGASAKAADAENVKDPHHEDNHHTDHRASHHFSFFAFDGQKGSLRWKHAAGDFIDELRGDELITPQLDYKLDAASTRNRHHGEMPWQTYKGSLLEQLPHRWSHRDDTKLSLAHFKKQKRRNTPVDKRALSSEIAGKDGFIVPKVAVRKASRSDRVGVSDTVEDPNVVVASLHHGIEVVHLYTGRTLCQLTLPDTGGHRSHGDINGDHVVEHVQAIGTSEEGADFRPMFLHDEEYDHGIYTGCMGVVTTGMPPHEALFNMSICEPHNSAARKFQRKEKTKLQTLAPVLLPKAGSNTLLSVFAVSSGQLSAYGHTGQLEWYTSTDATWSYGSKLSHFMQKGVVPSLQPMALEPGEPEQYVVLVGEGTLAITDAHGTLVSETELPDHPVGPPVFGDFNGDGWHDIVLPCQRGVIGFELVPTQGSLIFKMVVGFMIMLIGVVVLSGGTAIGSGGKVKRAID